LKDVPPAEEGVPVQCPSVVFEVSHHQEAVEDEGGKCQDRAHGLVIQNHRPVERTRRDRHHYAERHRNEKARENQRPGDQLDGHGDADQP
jgi:hypothetical protein